MEAGKYDTEVPIFHYDEDLGAFKIPFEKFDILQKMEYKFNRSKGVLQ